MCKAAASSPAQIREFQYKKGKVGEEEEETLPALCVGIGDKDEEEGGDLEQREFLPPDTAGGERMGMRGRGGLDRGAGGGMIAVKEQGDAKAEGEEEDVAACGCGHEHAACAAGDVGLVVSALRGALGCRRNGGCRAGGGGWWSGGLVGGAERRPANTLRSFSGMVVAKESRVRPSSESERLRSDARSRTEWERR